MPRRESARFSGLRVHTGAALTHNAWSYEFHCSAVQIAPHRIPDPTRLRIEQEIGVALPTDLVQRGSDGNWIVPIPGHSPYSFTRMKCGFDAPDSRHKVVLIDIKKLLACADRDKTDYVLQGAQYWHAGKVRGIREFLAPGQERIPEIPYVTFTTRRCRTLAGLIGLAREGVVSFRNGQHRARYLAFAGAGSLPVEVHETEADLLERFCGWGRHTRGS